MLGHYAQVWEFVACCLEEAALTLRIAIFFCRRRRRRSNLGQTAASHLTQSAYLLIAIYFCYNVLVLVCIFLVIIITIVNSIYIDDLEILLFRCQDEDERYDDPPVPQSRDGLDFFLGSRLWPTTVLW